MFLIVFQNYFGKYISREIFENPYNLLKILYMVNYSHTTCYSRSLRAYSRRGSLWTGQLIKGTR